MDKSAQPTKIQILQQEEEEEQAHLRDYYSILKRRWWIVLIAFALVLLLTVAYLAMKPDMYTATALVRIPGRNSSNGLAAALGGFLPIGPSSSVSTEIEIIKLRSTAEAAIRGLGIDKREQNLELKWEQIVSRFRSNLKVRQRGMSDLIEITMTAISADDSRDFANEVASQYIGSSKVSQQKLWQSLMDEMGDRLTQVALDLEESRRRLYEHESEEGISTAFGPLLTGGGTSAGGNQYMIPDVPQAVAQLKTGIMQMEVELEALKESFAVSDPEVVKLGRQIAASKRRLEQETDKALEKYNKQFGLTRVAAEVVFNQQLYSSLVTKQEELKAQHIMQNRETEIIEEATTPLYPGSPNRKLIFMVGAAMGLFMGLGLALFREYMDNSMHKAEDLTEAIDIPVLGKIPRPGGAIHTFRKSRPGKMDLINYEDSSRRRRIRELYRESYRMLQLEMMAAINAEMNSDSLVFLVTSSVTGEGKSVAAANLAISIAQTGRKVLLVDADSHSSVHCELLDLDPEAGLMDVLVGNIGWEDAVKETKLENLYVITTGDENGQSDLSSLLISSRLEEIMDSWRDQFDVIIFDSSPVISTSESAAIGSKVDGVVLVVKADKTQKDAILQAKQRIQNAGGNILGAVLNHTAIEKKYYR